ncbi:MAG: twitch domain-containing radical SAM protein, partial [Pseudomonadota bacterium]
MRSSTIADSKHFCILPFIHGATLTDGHMPLCCVSEGTSSLNLNKETFSDHWNSKALTNVRKKLMKDQPIKDCRRCYEEEKNGYRSHRVIENKAWIEKLGSKAIDGILEDFEEKEIAGVIAIDLRLGNTCNLQCVMCQPRESSKWNGAAKKFIGELRDQSLVKEWNYKRNIKVENFEWYRNSIFWENLKSFLPTLREIIIGGGEPMLIKEHLQFIKECTESGEAAHIHLRYHTNMTVFPEEMVPYWEKFERVEFFSSIDGMEDVGHYVRYPAQWDKVENNVQ